MGKAKSTFLIPLLSILAMAVGFQENPNFVRLIKTQNPLQQMRIFVVMGFSNNIGKDATFYKVQTMIVLRKVFSSLRINWT